MASRVGVSACGSGCASDVGSGGGAAEGAAAALGFRFAGAGWVFAGVFFGRVVSAMGFLRFLAGTGWHMTGGGMNATLDRLAAPMRLASGLLLAGLCAACVASPFDRAADPSSPAAARVNELASANTAYPRWEDFPAEPTNVPTAADIRNGVLGLQASETRLNTQLAALQWTLGPDDGEPWAERTRNRIDLRLAQSLDPDFLQRQLDWAEQQRRRSVAPPRLND